MEDIYNDDLQNDKKGEKTRIVKHEDSVYDVFFCFKVCINTFYRQ